MNATLTSPSTVDISTVSGDSGKVMLLAGESYELITDYTNLPDITKVSINLDNGVGALVIIKIVILL